MKKIIPLIIGLLIAFSSYGQDTISFPTGMSELSSISSTDTYLTDDGDSSQYVTMQDIMDYLEGNMALETLLTKTIGGDVTITGSNTNNITLRASQSGQNSASIRFYSDGLLDISTHANDDYSGDQAYIQLNEQYLLLSTNFVDDEKSILIDGTSMRITDTEDLVGLQYVADYSTNGLSNSRWIPDIGAVRSEVSDSILGFESAIDLNTTFRTDAVSITRNIVGQTGRVLAGDSTLFADNAVLLTFPNELGDTIVIDSIVYRMAKTGADITIQGFTSDTAWSSLAPPRKNGLLLK